MIRSHVPRMDVQNVSLDRVVGMVCADAVHAPGDQPRFDSAAMDGWVVCGNHATYRVAGESRAGLRFDGELNDGEAVGISTGAVMPLGATALIRREQASVDRGTLQIGAYTPGRDIRQRGCDFRAGDALLEAGQAVGHMDVARVAAAGLCQVPVHRCPRVTVLATGDEIVPAGALASADSNYDALSPAVLGRLRGAGALATHLGIASDCHAAIQDRLAQALGEVLIVIGGASGGRHDRVRHALGARGLNVIVPCVSMRPGKPFWSGVMDNGQLVFGLPGNPVAALVAMELFVMPALMAMMGSAHEQHWIDLVDRPCEDTGDMARIRFARWDWDARGRLVAQPLGSGDSAALSPLRGANGLIRSGEGYPVVRFLPLSLRAGCPS